MSIDVPLGYGANTAISVHDVYGAKITDDVTSVDLIDGPKWGRELKQVSRCEFKIPIDHSLAVSGVPWQHWVTVWEYEQPVWTGPILKIADDGVATATVSARDTSTFFWQTRIPISRTWQLLTPSTIADYLWRAMADLHNINSTPIILPDVQASQFTMTLVADSKKLNAVMDDLVKLGLGWTVYAGRPIFGRAPDIPVAAFLECDFQAAISRERDGSNTSNDVRLQGKNYVDNFVVPLAGLHLQSLVSMDNLGGVSNILRAGRQYVAQTAKISDRIVVPSDTMLNPDTDVTVAQLVPGARFIVDARGITALMELQSMQVNNGPGNYAVAVTLQQVFVPTEIEKGGPTI